jgi:hypothetical protein
MRALIQSLSAVFNRGARLTQIERVVIDVVGSHLTSPALTIWEQQVRAIYKIQRLPDGVEVDFYMREGAGRRPAPLPRFRHRDEFVIAMVVIDVFGAGAPLKTSVWCVSGRLFSIEYKGSIKYLDEALGMDPTSELHVTAQLTNEASAFIEEP